MMWLLLGISLGAIAGLQFNNMLRYPSAGLVGAILGGYLLTAYGLEFPLTQSLLRQLISGTIGATVVILIARFLE